MLDQGVGRDRGACGHWIPVPTPTWSALLTAGLDAETL